MIAVAKWLIVFLSLYIAMVNTSTAQGNVASPTVILSSPTQELNCQAVYISSVAGTFKTVLQDVDKVKTCIGISPDAHYLVYTTGSDDVNQTLVVLDITSGQRFFTDLQSLDNETVFTIIPSQTPQLWTVASCQSIAINQQFGFGQKLRFMNRQTHQLDLTLSIYYLSDCGRVFQNAIMSPDGNSIMAFNDCRNLAFTHFDTQLAYLYAPYAAPVGGCLSPQPSGKFLWSRDSKSIIGTRYYDGIVYYNPFFLYSSGYPQNLLKLRGIGGLFDWQPNHDAFLFSTRTDENDKPSEKLFIFDMTTRKATEIPLLGSYPRWSPSGRYIAGTRLSTDATGNPRFDVVIYDVEHAAMIPITSDQPGSTCNPQWSPDGTLIAYDMVDAQQNGKTGCFNPHGVAAIHWLTHTDWILLSRQSSQAVSLIGWVQP